MFKSQWTAALIGSVLLAAGSTTAHAAVDFSGYCILNRDPQAVPAASVTPAAAATVKKMLAANDFSAPNGSPEYAKQFCTVEGMPWQMTHALPLDIRQGTLTVSITPSVEADPRHIYIEGQ